MVQTRFPRVINVENSDLQQWMEEVRLIFQQLATVPFLDGHIIEDVDLTTTTLKINHKLGRAYTGVFALDGTGLVVDTTNDVPKEEIWVALGSGSRTVDLWVY